MATYTSNYQHVIRLRGELTTHQLGDGSPTDFPTFTLPLELLIHYNDHEVADAPEFVQLGVCFADGSMTWLNEVELGADKLKDIESLIDHFDTALRSEQAVDDDWDD